MHTVVWMEENKLNSAEIQKVDSREGKDGTMTFT